ncbi:MAG: hypothetical protein DME24_24405, partial [Verrucomicrobia bacterium]
MKRRFAIVGAVALIIVSALVFWLNRGPRYEGKPPGYWVEQLLHDNAKARQALQKIGPAAVPALAEAVSRRRGRVWAQLEAWRPMLPAFIARKIPRRALDQLLQ